MIKHRGFPSRMKSSDFNFTIRRASKDGATELKARERYKDRKHSDKKVDEAFLEAIMTYFGSLPFERGNLDAGRLSWFLGREIVPVDENFDPYDYEAKLQIDLDLIFENFPNLRYFAEEIE